MANSGEILFVSRETPDDETRRLFENRGFQLTAISDFAMASNSISQARFSAIVVDVRVGSDAINLIRFVRQHEQARRCHCSQSVNGERASQRSHYQRALMVSS